MPHNKLRSTTLSIISLRIQLIELLYLVDGGINTVELTPGSLAIAEAFLVDATEFVAVLGEHLGKVGVVVDAAAVPMHKEHDPLPLLPDLHGPPVVVDFLTVHAKVYRIRAVFRPLNRLVVDKLIFELPLFKSNLLPILISHILTLHISSNLPKNDFVPSRFLSVICLGFDFVYFLQDQILVRSLIICQQSLRIEHPFLLVLNP